jgi:flagellar hook-length control protein FliK
MTTIASSLAPAVNVSNKTHLMDKTASSNTSFGSLFSDALVNSQSQINMTQSLGLADASRFSTHAAHRPNPSFSAGANLQDGSVQNANESTLKQANEAHKPHDPKKTKDKTHTPVNHDASSTASPTADTSQSSSAPSSATNDSSSAMGNTQTAQANATQTDPTQNPAPTPDNSTRAAQSNVHGLSASQEAFLAGLPMDGATNNPNNVLAESQSEVMNASHFAQAMVTSIQNPAINGSNSLPVAGGALASIGGSSALSNTSGLNHLSAQPDASQDLIYAEGLQENSAANTMGETASLTSPTGSSSLSIAPALGEGPWAAALGQQALFIAKNQMGSAQLNLNPEHLGPIQITLDLKHDQASAVFVSPHEAVRQAIEASLPQLRDMFTQAGLELGQTQVQPDLSGQFAQSSQQNQDQDAAGSRSSASSLNTIGEGATAVPSLVASGSATKIYRGLLDTFA